MKAISFSLDNFDLVINSFDFASVDRVVAVVDDTIAMAFKHIGKSG